MHKPRTVHLKRSNYIRSNYKERKLIQQHFVKSLIGGANRDRTGDLLNAIQALSQLSYSPTPTLPQRACLERGVWIPCQGRMCQVFSGMAMVPARTSLLPSSRDFVKLRRFSWTYAVQHARSYLPASHFRITLRALIIFLKGLLQCFLL
jgi:hypothetical protein